MRRKLVLGVGLASILSGTAAGQFAGDRMPAGQPQGGGTVPFGGLGGGQPIGRPSVPPAGAGGYVPPVGGLQPASNTTPNGLRPAAQPQLTQQQPAQQAEPLPQDIPLALGPNHPMAVRPEDGEYFVCVKSYSRPARPDPSDPGLTARELAEGLAGEIQQAQGCKVYLYEYISEEKKAEAAAAAAARQRANALLSSLDKYRKTSQLQGMEFLAPDNRIRYRTFKYRDQIAVFVGGYRSEDEAAKALAKVKTWPAPKDNRLLDGGAISKVGKEGKQVVEKTYLNPFPQAMIVRNPVMPKPTSQEIPRVDPFLVKLNEGRPYNLLKATGTWTLGVKTFTTPITIQSKDADNGFMRKMGFGRGGEALRAGAEQAEALAKALREMKDQRGEALNLEAFVLHTRTGSIVTVGQFDGPNDVTLHETRQRLMKMKFHVSRDERGAPLMQQTESIFNDIIVPVMIPKP